MSRPILLWPDPRLALKSEPVTAFDEKLHALLDEMAATMTAAGGLGLSAIQLGEPLRVFVVRDGDSVAEFINPVVTPVGMSVRLRESCLSMPGFFEPCWRRLGVDVSHQDRTGKHFEARAAGPVAHAIQHEAEHLDGRMFFEPLGAAARQRARLHALHGSRRVVAR